MPDVKTSWEDLSRLGWPIQEVYNKANSQRGGSMNGLGDLFLNNGIAADYQWWSYNQALGGPYLISSVPNSTKREETAWSYDNTQNDKPFKDTWTESWQNKTSADLSITTSASISVNTSISIPDVGSTGFSMSISTSSTEAQHKEEAYSLSHTWDLEVGAHEKLELIRTIQTSITTEAYGQKLGLANGSMCGTKGDKYNGHYYWGYDLNGLLGSPTGTMTLQGIGRVTQYTFRIVRTAKSAQTSTLVPTSLKEGVLKVAEAPQEIFHAVAGVGTL